MTRQSKTNDYAYAAGLIDGEGCISIHKSYKEDCGYSLVVNMNICDGVVVDYLYGRFGGKAYYIKDYSKDGSKRLAVYRWEIKSHKAAEFLKKILPFLKIKHEQAKLGLQFQTHIKSNGFRPISDTEKLLREELYNKVRELKTIHSSCAVVETKYKHTSFNNNNRSEAIVQPQENKEIVNFGSL